MQNKQYFPLFIDLESHAIFSVEWTTKYPMLHITLLPEVYKLIEDLNSLSVDEIIEDMNKDINERKIKSANFKFTKNEIEEIKNKIDNKESISWFIEKFKDLEKTYTLDDLDRVKDIFSLIQTNYFLQMDQPEENALFLDIDTNFLLKPKVNIGAVPFMNKDDLDLLGGVHNKDRESYNNNLKFIDPYNYSIEGKDESLSAFNIQNRKVEGLPSEQKSKEGMKRAKIVKQSFIERGELNIFETRDLIGKTEALYGYNYLNHNKGESFKKSNYRVNPEKLKLFTTKEELDNYIKKYNEVIERAFIA